MNVGGITPKLAKLPKLSVLRQPAHSSRKKTPRSFDRGALHY